MFCSCGRDEDQSDLLGYFSAFEDAKLLTIGIADEKYKKYKNVMEVEA